MCFGNLAISFSAVEIFLFQCFAKLWDLSKSIKKQSVLHENIEMYPAWAFRAVRLRSTRPQAAKAPSATAASRNVEKICVSVALHLFQCPQICCPHLGSESAGRIACWQCLGRDLKCRSLGSLSKAMASGGAADWWFQTVPPAVFATGATKATLECCAHRAKD